MTTSSDSAIASSASSSSPTRTSPPTTAMVAGTAPAERTAASNSRATRRLSGRGSPWLMIVLSRATTGPPAASASRTSSCTRICRATVPIGLVDKPRIRCTCSSLATRPICSSRSRYSPAATTPLPVPERHDVLGTPLKPPFPEGLETRRVRAWAASGAPSACSGRRPASTPPRSATPAARRRTRPTRRCAPARTGHTEVVLVVFDPQQDLLRGAAEAVLGEPRPDPGHAPGQRRRHPVPLGDLLRTTPAAARGRRGVARGATRRSSTRPATARSRPRSPRPGPFYYAEDYHQQYLAKNPNGYCGLGGTGVPARSGPACRAKPESRLGVRRRRATRPRRIRTCRFLRRAPQRGAGPSAPRVSTRRASPGGARGSPRASRS